MDHIQRLPEETLEVPGNSQHELCWLEGPEPMRRLKRVEALQMPQNLDSLP